MNVVCPETDHMRIQEEGVNICGDLMHVMAFCYKSGSTSTTTYCTHNTNINSKDLFTAVKENGKFG